MTRNELLYAKRYTDSEIKESKKLLKDKGLTVSSRKELREYIKRMEVHLSQILIALNNTKG